VSFEIEAASDMDKRPNRLSLLVQAPGDTGNSERFLARHRDDVRYCHAFKSWFYWDDRRWRRDDQEHVTRLAKQVMFEFYTQAVEANDRDAERFARISLDTARIKGLLALARGEAPITPADFDDKPDLLVFKNGTLNLSTGVMRDFERADFITKLVHFDYRPEAECPRFLNVLRRLMGAAQDEARAERLVSALQVYFGYSLTGYTTSKAVFMLIGPKDTGKTTVLELFCRLLAEHSTLIRIETLMEGSKQRTLGQGADLADLHGARFARTSETEEGKRLSEAQLKYITQGMGSIRAERKFENPFDFEETHKLWIDANHKPIIRGTDASIWDRLITIPFDAVIPEADKDPQLLATLLTEAGGILAWAAAGARQWYADGRRIPRPEEVRTAGEVYRADMDTVGQFLIERCELGGSFTVRSSEIYAEYRQWAESGGEHPMTQKMFSSRMKNRSGILSEHKEYGTLFVGVRLKAESPRPESEKS
jgi:putative DNA primase/helicase